MIADISSAFYACILILSFIAGRNTTGEGCYIDLAMAESVLSILNLEFAKHFSKSSIKGAPNVTYLPHYNIYKCSDDSWITLGIVDENHFLSGFFVATGLDDIKDWDLIKEHKTMNIMQVN